MNKESCEHYSTRFDECKILKRLYCKNKKTACAWFKNKTHKARQDCKHYNASMNKCETLSDIQCTRCRFFKRGERK